MLIKGAQTFTRHIGAAKIIRKRSSAVLRRVLIQAGQFIKGKWGWTLMDLPFPPCVALTV